MYEAFCVLYRDFSRAPPAKRLSQSYDSLELAIGAACDVAQRNAEPMQIRGSEGTVIERAELAELIATVAV
ncbi:MAG TPA: hypothetical protein VEH76_02825 [Methylocystis sp.]|nr:hypothetical protein [Methylocystis sp.]